MKIYNFTQHQATPEQQAAGVVDLPEEKQAYLHDLLAGFILLKICYKFLDMGIA